MKTAGGGEGGTRVFRPAELRRLRVQGATTSPGLISVGLGEFVLEKLGECGFGMKR